MILAEGLLIGLITCPLSLGSGQQFPAKYFVFSLDRWLGD